MSVADLESPVQSSNGTPRFPSILVVGPAHTPQAHDVTEPPAISSQLPDVRKGGRVVGGRGERIVPYIRFFFPRGLIFVVSTDRSHSVNI